MADNFFVLSPTYIAWSGEKVNAQLAGAIREVFSLLDKDYNTELDVSQMQEFFMQRRVGFSRKMITSAFDAINFAVEYLDGSDEVANMLIRNRFNRKLIPLQCLLADEIDSWDKIRKERLRRKRAAEAKIRTDLQGRIYVLKMDLADKERENAGLREESHELTTRNKLLSAKLVSEQKRAMALETDLGQKNKKLKSYENQFENMHAIPDFLDSIRGSTEFKIIAELSKRIGFRRLPIWSTHFSRLFSVNPIFLGEVNDVRPTKSQIEELEKMIIQIASYGLDFLEQKKAIERLEAEREGESKYGLKFYRFIIEILVTEERIILQRFYVRRSLSRRAEAP